jgi:rSAM/selenodomain-associated transferase 1
MPEHRRLILFFLKYPEPGEVKTRLAASIGPERAAELARAMAEDMLDELRWVEEADLAVCFAPAEREADMRAWLGEREYWPQRGAGLGQRMKNGFQAAFHRGYERVVLLGSDIPEARDEDVRRALAHLEKRRSCALGPAEDGGYWLIGFDREGFSPEVFAGMEWGGPEVLGRTRSWLEFNDRDVLLLEQRRDVDTMADLERLVASAALAAGSATLGPARRALAGAAGEVAANGGPREEGGDQ